MMGLFEYVYVDAHEIVAFKLIGFAKRVKNNTLVEENTC